MDSITYEQIKAANEAIKPTDIGRGKEYVEVNQRIKAFRMCYPNGTIETEMLSNENGVCVFRAIISNDDVVLGTGTAYEKEGSTFINKTSYIENCETSAVGRALGMCGFGIDTSLASAEEVQNAIINQDDGGKIGKPQIEVIKKYYQGENMEKLLKANNLTKLEDMSANKAGEILSKLANASKEKK